MTPFFSATLQGPQQLRTGILAVDYGPNLLVRERSRIILAIIQAPLLSARAAAAAIRGRRRTRRRTTSRVAIMVLPNTGIRLSILKSSCFGILQLPVQTRSLRSPAASKTLNPNPKP